MDDFFDEDRACDPCKLDEHEDCEGEPCNCQCHFHESTLLWMEQQERARLIALERAEKQAKRRHRRAGDYSI